MTKARSNAVANAAKGDLTVGNGTNLSGILAVGNNGESLVADSTAATGLRWQSSNAAGKNVVINGGFDVWQRGTSFSAIATNAYSADRFKYNFGGTGSNATITQDTGVPNAASKYSIKVQQLSTSATSVSEYCIRQLFETSQILQLTGNTVTLSFWYKSNKTGSHAVRLYASPMTGGTDVKTAFTVSAADTWEKKVINFSSFAGVTTASTAPTAEAAGLDIGFNVFTLANFPTISANDYFQIAQVQLEVGSVNTSFTRASGNISTELAACQRYCFRIQGQSSVAMGIGSGYANSTTAFRSTIRVPVTMRTTPVFTSSNVGGSNAFHTIVGSTQVYSDSLSANLLGVDGNGLSQTTSGITTGQGGEIFIDSGKTTSFLEWSAEL